MRISLCFRHRGAVYRLVWLNESKNGLYVGILGGEEEFHVSYHQDGHRHMKMGNDYLLPSQDVELAKWRGVRQLDHYSLSVSEQWFSANNAYSGDAKTETVVLLDEGLFSERDTCALDVWLLDRTSEPELFAVFGRCLATNQKFRPAVEVVAALEAFPDHKVGVMLRTARIRGNPE